MLKAVLFDMDDTLIDWSKRTLDWQEQDRHHLQLVFEYVTREVCPIEATPELFCDSVRQYARLAWMEAEEGLRAPSYGDALRHALEHMGVPGNLIDVNACLRAYGWQLIQGVTVFPDVPDVLHTLFFNNILIGLITNASVPMWLRDRELEACDLLRYFTDCRLSAVDVGYIKPHPIIFETALNRLGISPAEAVFVGDNPEADVVGAQRVGMRGVLRVTPNNTFTWFDDEIVPDGVVESFYELLPLLDKWYPGWRFTSQEASV
jgi:putative hydrolase of the HAD superfamily